MKYLDLQNLTDEELIKKYDDVAESTQIGLNYYTEELARRRNEKSNKLMLNYTRWIVIMTAVMLLCTIVNVIIAVVNK